MISSSVIWHALSASCAAFAPTARAGTYHSKMYQDLSIDPSILTRATLDRGRGCDSLQDTPVTRGGWRYEAMTFPRKLAKLIMREAIARDGQNRDRPGMRTLRMVAVDVFREGGLDAFEQCCVTRAH